MNEMARRMDDVPIFYNVIQKHAAFAVSLTMNGADFERAKSRIWSDNTKIVWGPYENMKNILINIFIKTFYEYCWHDEKVRDWLGMDGKIDLYFDSDISPDWMLDELKGVTNAVPEYARHFIGDQPRFVDDEEFLPMQAADFWAWWCRKGIEDGNMDAIGQGNFGAWSAKKVPGFRLSLNEDRMTELLILWCSRSMPIYGLANFHASKKKPQTGNAISSVTIPKRANFFSFIEMALRALKRPRR